MNDAASITRAEVEDFLYQEAALLDEWRMDEWLELLTEDARYEVPPNDVPGGASANTLFTIADDINRIRARLKRLNNDRAHAEYPHSRTRRMISNVRILDRDGERLSVSANFICHRFRRSERIRQYVGQTRYELVVSGGVLKITRRTVLIDAHELGSLGSVSFIL
ncbi:MAG: aromatic-ring-hydroxylating dioxygenase subunit beta [Pseudomonadota bacterium]|nr:aromatic-ring-hydroxylating dioxygenase subunit beta [Pseudomonadota bacterium]